jgi:hypothetical protein
MPCTHRLVVACVHKQVAACVCHGYQQVGAGRCTYTVYWHCLMLLLRISLNHTPSPKELVQHMIGSDRRLVAVFAATGQSTVPQHVVAWTV